MEWLSFALLAILIGMRHGMDSDHVAAIADMVGSENGKKRQVSLGVMYAFGHGLIVLCIGLVTLFIGTKLPEGAQNMIEICVGLTLLILGGIILHSLFQQNKEYEFKSRLRIVYEFVLKFLKKSGKGVDISPVGLGIISALIIGIIHGVGVESPTQIAIITNAAGVDNTTAAALQLILFVVGLLASTIFITFLLSWGFTKAKFRRKLYIVLGSVTGIYSIGLGISIMAEIMKGGL
ncbi:High-affinity nickel-transporter [Bacillus songklensis]|uniref:Nickel/cobalt efflux system n=1 Tax=Bacillus songklensis TaxID=1069116 RepID=A0ABV8B122_9BACI